MEEIKKDSEILAEIYRNAQLGITSISDILPEIEDEFFFNVYKFA